jgi:hypothetical protein
MNSNRLINFSTNVFHDNCIEKKIGLIHFITCLMSASYSRENNEINALLFLAATKLIIYIGFAYCSRFYALVCSAHNTV